MAMRCKHRHSAPICRNLPQWKAPYLVRFAPPVAPVQKVFHAPARLNRVAEDERVARWLRLELTQQCESLALKALVDLRVRARRVVRTRRAVDELRAHAGCRPVERGPLEHLPSAAISGRQRPFVILNGKASISVHQWPSAGISGTQ